MWDLLIELATWSLIIEFVMFGIWIIVFIIAVIWYLVQNERNKRRKIRR